MKNWSCWKGSWPNRLPYNNQGAAFGFTLLELLIAVAVLAILSTLAFQGLRTVLDSQRHYQQSAQRLQAVHRLFLWLGRDLEHAINRNIRAEYGDRLPSLQGDSTQPRWLELTRTGWHNLLQQPRSSLQRVGYHWHNRTIYRDSWQVLDRAQDSNATPVELLTEVTQVQIRFLDKTATWHTQWPPALDPEQAMPKAIEITLTLPDWGTIKRLFQPVDA